MHVFKCQPWVILRKKEEKKQTSQNYSWAEIGFNYQQVNEKLLHEEHKLLSASIIRRQRTFLANYTFSAEPCLLKCCVYSLSSYLVTTGERHIFCPTTSIPEVFSWGLFFFFSAVWCLDRMYCFWLDESVRPLRGVSELLFELLCVDGVP